MGPEEDDLDAQSLQMTILPVCMLPISYLIGLYNMNLFFFSFLFNLSLGLEVTVMPDFLISQRIFVLRQQFMDGCDQSGSMYCILVIVNIFFTI